MSKREKLAFLAHGCRLKLIIRIEGVDEGLEHIMVDEGGLLSTSDEWWGKIK